MEKHCFMVDDIKFVCEFEKDILTLLYIETNMTTPLVEGENENLKELKDFLKGYLEGKCENYKGKINIQGTEQQKKVCHAAITIPYGEKKSYSELSEMAGISKGARFAGNVMAENKLIIIIPCHRIIKKDGSIGSYGPGSEYKKRFLKIEGSI